MKKKNNFSRLERKRIKQRKKEKIERERDRFDIALNKENNAKGGKMGRIRCWKYNK